MNIHIQAAEAATHWQGRILRLIRNRENAVFEMETPKGRAALRLHRIGYQSAAAIKSELWWCAALSDAGVAVSRPLLGKNGSTLIQLADGRHASAIAWVNGEPLGEAGVAFHDPLPVQLARHAALGRLLAEVHCTTDRLTLPADFHRPYWNIEGLVGENPFWGRFWEHPGATKTQAEVLRDARQFLADRLTKHAINGDFGPIHADVLRENVLVNDNSLSLIDFDDCGFGFRAYDLGTVLSQTLYEPHYAEIRDALIAGYAETRPLDAETIEMFTLARTCASVGWTMPRLALDDPVHKTHIARCVMWAERIIR